MLMLFYSIFCLLEGSVREFCVLKLPAVEVDVAWHLLSLSAHSNVSGLSIEPEQYGRQLKSQCTYDKL
jgi:hypothetical protein